MKEPKLNEEFEHEGIKFVCVESDGCRECSLYHTELCGELKCGNYEREDDTGVVFKRIDDSILAKIKLISRAELEELCVKQNAGLAKYAKIEEGEV